MKHIERPNAFLEEIQDAPLESSQEQQETPAAKAGEADTEKERRLSVDRAVSEERSAFQRFFKREAGGVARMLMMGTVLAHGVACGRFSDTESVTPDRVEAPDRGEAEDAGHGYELTRPGEQPDERIEVLRVRFLDQEVEELLRMDGNAVLHGSLILDAHAIMRPEPVRVPLVQEGEDGLLAEFSSVSIADDSGARALRVVQLRVTSKDGESQSFILTKGTIVSASEVHVLPDLPPLDLPSFER